MQIDKESNNILNKNLEIIGNELLIIILMATLFIIYKKIIKCVVNIVLIK